jgi:ubiquinone/menaquinone biosynthesis C-methylase UbiE
MMQSYVLNSAHICDVIRPGDTVMDLACGPATLLAMVAKLNPDVRFIGADLSDEMLSAGRRHLAEQDVHNVELRTADITNLSFAKDRSLDGVVSTFSLHHLPTVEMLDAAFAEVDRVLKPTGGVFLFDFVHLKSEASIDYFATRHAHLQSDFFTEDYRNSLRAAFHLEDIQRLAEKHLGQRGTLYVTSPMRLMFAIKGSSRQTEKGRIREELRRMRSSLPEFIERDLRDALRLFRHGGLETELLD